MINPDDETITDLSTSCTIDVAVAKMLGWMQGNERLRYIQVTLNGISADQLPHLHSLDSLQEQLTELRQVAHKDFIQARETGAAIEIINKKKAAITECSELISKAATYLRAIDDEIAKGDSSALRIDQRATEESGVVHVTLNSVDQWARTKYRISIFSSGSLTEKTPEPERLPSSGIDADMAIEQDQKKQPRLDAQEKAILNEIKRLGHDPKTLQKSNAGKPGVKAAVRNALKANDLFAGTTVFDRAWERLRKYGDIAEVK